MSEGLGLGSAGFVARLKMTSLVGLTGPMPLSQFAPGVKFPFTFASQRTSPGSGTMTSLICVDHLLVAEA